MICRAFQRGLAARTSATAQSTLKPTRAIPTMAIRPSSQSFSARQSLRPAANAQLRTSTSHPHFSTGPPSAATTGATSKPSSNPEQTREQTPTASAPNKPDFLDEAESVIWDRLVAAFAPVDLVVRDVSGGCGSMYAIDITSARFRGATMLKQQRMVNAELTDLMAKWHGVQLRTKVP